MDDVCVLALCQDVDLHHKVLQLRLFDYGHPLESGKLARFSVLGLGRREGTGGCSDVNEITFMLASCFRERKKH